MHRPFILGLAVLAVFFGLVTVLPLLESDVNSPQVAAVAQVPDVVELPSCIISVHPDIIEKGEEASLVWSAQHAMDVSLSGLGEVLPQDGIFIRPVESQIYTLTVRAFSGDISSCETSITVL